MGVTRQATFIPGDATALDRLEGPFDIILYGAVLHYFDPPEIASILREARRLLSPTGRLVVIAPLMTPGDYEDPEPFLTAVWMLNVAPRGRVYEVADYARMLADAGFDAPTRVGGASWLSARPVA
jgi:ubiquinone/menaquinone biosynthesis C-methylase UbiE